MPMPPLGPCSILLAPLWVSISSPNVLHFLSHTLSYIFSLSSISDGAQSMVVSHLFLPPFSPRPQLNLPGNLPKSTDPWSRSTTRGLNVPKKQECSPFPWGLNSLWNRGLQEDQGLRGGF